jgi:hypothetical protein
MPLLDAVVHLPVAMYARLYVEELWELEAEVPEHRHCRLRAQKLKLSMVKPSKIRSKTSLSRTNLRNPHQLGGCDGGPDPADAEDDRSLGAPWQWWKPRRCVG